MIQTLPHPKKNFLFFNLQPVDLSPQYFFQAPRHTHTFQLESGVIEEDEDSTGEEEDLVAKREDAAMAAAEVNSCCRPFFSSSFPLNIDLVYFLLKYVH